MKKNFSSDSTSPGIGTINSTKIIKIRLMYFKLHLWLHINKTYIKIYLNTNIRFVDQNNIFCKICFRAKTRRIYLVFKIGHEGIKFITFTTEENLFKEIKF